MLGTFGNPHQDSLGAAMQTGNARLGLWLFGFYSLLYGAFVFVNAFAPAAMERTLDVTGTPLAALAGVNLAILSGFGLIVVAILLALLYGVLCSPADAKRQPPEGPR